MASYVINGASRGIGFEFLRQLSANPANTVVGLVRDPKSVEPKVESELGRSNIHIVKGDLDDYESLKQASEATAKITGGSLDYLIANGARMSLKSAFVGIGELGQDHALLEHELLDDFKTNVIGNINLFNLFMPLILKGKQKKILYISSGHGDLDLINQVHIAISGPYAIGKAAANVAVAKLNAEYAKDGVMLMSISPGVVDTGIIDPSKLSEKEQQAMMAFGAQMQKHSADFKGPIQPDESVSRMLGILDNASNANGDGGSFVSHLGNKQWV